MEYEEKYSRYQLHLLDEPPPFLSELSLDLNFRLVLDLGCGGGINSYYLKQNFPRASLFSLDLSPIRCRQCRQYIDTSVIRADSTLLPLKDNPFDMVICTMLIEHVSDDRRLVEEIHRILKPEGQVFISSVIKGKHAWYFRRNQFGKPVLDSTHVREYSSRDEFLSLFNRFEVLNVTLRNVSLSWARFIYRLLVRFSIIRTGDPLFFTKTSFLNNLARLKLSIPNYKEIELWGRK
ncbi:MAG TPA: class I SAM-dependent methyltransferase [Thermodesulfobacteriota bacterium]|nr:class I SAM-dependent methyltransferase [Thermodesulfobacteriota bacterium]